jgi:hypothetical protein
MIMDVARHRLIGPEWNMDECELKKPSKLLHLKFHNKGIDAVNINNILNHRNVQSCILPYFKMKSTPFLRIGKVLVLHFIQIYFHYSLEVIWLQTLQSLEIEQLRQNSPKCYCSSSSLNYSPAGHIITGDVNIVKMRI